MKTYTLHLPAEAGPGDRDALDRAELVKDGFSWGAFFFTAFWFFFHRLWLAGLAVLALMIAFDVGLAALDVRPGPAALAHVLLMALVGLEANSLRRWTYARSGRPVADVITATDREEAEIKAFGRWLAPPDGQRGPASMRAPAASPAFRGPDPVIGLFPDPEIRR
jgi:hypothetical protein